MMRKPRPLLLLAALACIGMGTAVPPWLSSFNAALRAYRGGRHAEAMRLWGDVAQTPTPPAVNALALFNAGDAAYRADRMPEADRLWRQALRVLDGIGSPTWPADWTPAQRQALLKRLETDILTNLELLRREKGAGPQPDEGKEQKQPAPKPGPPKEAKGKGRPTDEKPGKDRRGEVPPLSPQEVERLMRRALARDVAPPLRRRKGTADTGRPDW